MALGYINFPKSFPIELGVPIVIGTLCPFFSGHKIHEGYAMDTKQSSKVVINQISATCGSYSARNDFKTS